MTQGRSAGRRWLVAVGVIGLAALIVAIAWQRSRAHTPLYSGSIEARNIEVGSLVGGRVAKVLVREGSQVRGGQALVELEPDFVEAQVRQQRGAVAEAEANLARLRRGPRPEEMARARSDARTTELERRRSETLLKSGAGTRKQYDEAVNKAAVAEETYRERRRGSRVEDVAAAEAAVMREEGRLQFLERQLKDLVIRAPANGVVETLDLRPGDIVAPNQAAATLLEPEELWIRAFVPEPELGRVHLGQAAHVSVDTFPDREFAGKVVEIRQQGEYTPRNLQTREQRNDQVFGVKIAISPNDALRPGMAAMVRLEQRGDSHGS